MNAPLVRVLAALLVLEQWLNKTTAHVRVEVQESGPGWEDHVDSVHVSIGGDFLHEDLDIAAVQRVSYPATAEVKKYNLPSIVRSARSLADRNLHRSERLASGKRDDRGIIRMDGSSIGVNLRVEGGGGSHCVLVLGSGQECRNLAGASGLCVCLVK